MRDKKHSSAPVSRALTLALEKSDIDGAQRALEQLSEVITNLTQQELLEHQAYFAALNEQMIGAIATLTKDKEAAKQQLSQYKANTNKLKAYSK
ncbi:hypothetical protein AAEU32_02140 [Pseudoalteromonas sp. SSDWG2]|uniref:hypothetical protein n=1 Tax=Pseudoalteromonas sp. SSDWG2 TaxID=3139391 RepID=UPI003BA9D3E7